MREKDRKTMKELESITVPLSIFQDRRLGGMESLVKHLREVEQLRNRDIARVLLRDDRTIWTMYSRAKEKLL
jgi:hypothetical protein